MKTANVGGDLGNGADNICCRQLDALYQAILLPFEVTSILILVAILGAVVLARKEQ